MLRHGTADIVKLRLSPVLYCLLPGKPLEGHFYFPDKKRGIYNLHDHRIDIGLDLDSGLGSGMFHGLENELDHGGA